MSKSHIAVISDTDILVHTVVGGIFFEVFPLLFSKIYITPKIEDELRISHRFVYSQLVQELNLGRWMRRTKEEWLDLTSEQRVLINKTKTRMRAKLDPGELDCYAFSLGMNIDVIISDDKGAKELITNDSPEKLVLTFWDVLIILAKKDLLAWSDAELHYLSVKEKAALKLPPFAYQLQRFEKLECYNHPLISKVINFD